MTAQIADEFIFNHDSYSLVGISGGELILPEQFGMEPEMIHTACYRGFYATYEITEDHLYLRELTLREKNGNYRPIEGVEPVENKEEGVCIYSKLNVPVHFTGKIRLAKDFIRKFYVHMGFQHPTAFKTVLDITLKDGQVIDINDRSKEIAKIRGAFKKRYESGDIDIMSRITEAFDMSMDL